MRAVSLDQLVGAGEQRWREGEAEYLGGGQVDNKFEFSRLLDRNIGRLCSAQNLVDKLGGPSEMAGEIWSIRHQTSAIDEVSLAVNRWQPRGERQRVDANPVDAHERLRTNIKC